MCHGSSLVTDALRFRTVDSETGSLPNAQFSEHPGAAKPDEPEPVGLGIHLEPKAERFV
jgi:hypothetical protein